MLNCYTSSPSIVYIWLNAWLRSTSKLHVYINETRSKLLVVHPFLEAVL
jgi:hypothetical protein